MKYLKPFNIFENSSENYTLTDLIDAAIESISNTDLDSAVSVLQGAINQDTGDGAGLFFSDIDNFESCDDIEEKITTMSMYVKFEISSYDMDYTNDYSNIHKNSKGELFNIANADTLIKIFKILSEFINKNKNIEEIINLNLNEIEKEYNNALIKFEKFKKRVKSHKFNL